VLNPVINGIQATNDQDSEFADDMISPHLSFSTMNAMRMIDGRTERDDTGSPQYQGESIRSHRSSRWGFENLGEPPQSLILLVV
jgi:hypothetical protein